jgi:DNA gyrase/topoisomerase IV subunit B
MTPPGGRARHLAIVGPGWKPNARGRHIATLLCALFVRHFRPVVEAGHVHVAMPPLYRIDVGHEVFYALDEEEKQGHLDRIAAEKRKARPNVQRFKGLGEMNPLQLRETTMAPETRLLLQLTLASGDETDGILEMLLAKKRTAERRVWLEEKGDLATAEQRRPALSAGCARGGPCAGACPPGGRAGRACRAGRRRS